MQRIASGGQDQVEAGEIATHPPLIAHVIHHLGIGGLENGLVNLINHIPPERYRHAIVCLKGYSEFRHRISRKDIEIVALNKREGQDFGLYLNLFRTLRRLKPDIVHTRNLGTMEGQVIAALAGARTRIHGEHGRDIFDLYGKNRKYNMLRKAISPFVDHFIAVSRDLESWLAGTVGAPRSRIDQIYNGVDTLRFQPASSKRFIGGPEGFFTDRSFVIGSVGRMAEVKSYPSLVQAFLMLLQREPSAAKRLRLLIVGDGSTRHRCMEMLREAGAQAFAWLPGERSDIPEMMQAMDLFVLPSLGEGISNTILEAMSTALPVIATQVGGNVELIRDGLTGLLIPPGEPAAIRDAILKYYKNPDLLIHHGQAARQHIEANFSMEAMTASYLRVYDKALRH
jgi:sugar transferase (PEP-CTERM/EpsH1 system associated)